eukprot:PhF_6_TR27209/c0_g1_i1/m.40023
MDTLTFEKRVHEMQTLNDSEGPHTNIFEPKFQSREQVLELRRVIKDIYSSPDTTPETKRVAQEQLCHLYLMLGNNMFETEEDKEGLEMMLRSLQILVLLREGKEYDFKEEPAYSLTELLGLSAHALRIPDAKTAAEHDYDFVELFVDIINAIGIVLSHRDVKQRIEDARRVLHHAELMYLSFDEWTKGQADWPRECPQDEFGNVAPEASTKEKQRGRLEKGYTTTVFYLAQAYGSESNTVKAAMYCHYTLARQLISRKEFSHKDWAKNALHISGFYMGEDDFSSAVYFIEASEQFIPTNNEEDRKEVTASIQLAKGRYYRYLLKRSADRLGDNAEMTGPLPDRAQIATWWCDLALPKPVVKRPADTIATTFEDAREYFKKSLTHLQEAIKEYFCFDGMCTDYIQIQFDISDLYKLLIVFEQDPERVAAMHERRAGALEGIAEKLNYNAYTNIVRKLWFELGDIYQDYADSRIQQRLAHKKDPTKPKGVSEKKVNEIVAKAKAYFVKFVESFYEKESKKLPSKRNFEKDLHATYVRALMRVARMETKGFAPDPKAEYENIQRALDRYTEILKFVEDYEVRDVELEQEVSLCREMALLLPGKMKDIWKTFNKMV